MNLSNMQIMQLETECLLYGYLQLDLNNPKCTVKACSLFHKNSKVYIQTAESPIKLLSFTYFSVFCEQLRHLKHFQTVALL